MEIVTVNSAVGTVTLPPEKDDFIHTLMNYSLTLSLLDSMVAQRVIAEGERDTMRDIIAKKHDLSLDSIFL